MNADGSRQRNITRSPGTDGHPFWAGRPLPQCSDAIDNDLDGAIDYPADPGCRRPTDNSE
jgi:hypothetical protein